MQRKKTFTGKGNTNVTIEEQNKSKGKRKDNQDWKRPGKMTAKLQSIN